MNRSHRVRFVKLLSERFNESELRTLCYCLEVDYDGLPGTGKMDKARELVAFLERRDRIPDLIGTGKELRPDIAWPEAPHASRLSRATHGEAGTQRKQGSESAVSPKTSKPCHPAGATALCRDGTYSFSETLRGACSHHGGVKERLQ